MIGYQVFHRLLIVLFQIQQLWVIHEIRNKIKYVLHKYRKAVMKELKKIYKALTVEEARFKFEKFKSF